MRSFKEQESTTIMKLEREDANAWGMHKRKYTKKAQNAENRHTYNTLK